MLRTRAALLVAIAIATPQLAQATAISTSNLGFSNLQINASGGDLTLFDFWELQAYAEARNSQGDLAQAFADNFFGGTKVEEGNAQASYTTDFLSVSTRAEVPWATARAAASDNSAVPPGLDVAGPVSTNVVVPGCTPKWAAGTARSDLFNGFMVTGGTGAVEVTFSVDLSGSKTVETDECGVRAWTELLFSLEIYDPLPDVLGTPQDQLVLFHKNLLECVGPNCLKTEIVGETLTATRVVEYDTSYYFVIETDDEQYAAVPAPPTLLLTLAGLATMVCRGRGARSPTA
jgi:hypothetical protein